ncbi:hypothetical protein D9M71_673990 [compost metagenome]
MQRAAILAFAEVAFFDIGIAVGLGPVFVFLPRTGYWKQFDDIVIAHFFLGKTAELFAERLLFCLEPAFRRRHFLGMRFSFQGRQRGG